MSVNRYDGKAMIEISQIVSDDNLELAFQRLKVSPKHIHKTLYWDSLKDFEPFRNEYYEVIREKVLLNKKTDESSVVKAYIPKKGGFVRPITYAGFESTLLYQAVINLLVAQYYHELSRYYDKITFGNHVNPDAKSPFMFVPWKKRWSKYQLVSSEFIEKRNFNFVVNFDIASFYDSIDHHLLIRCLENDVDEESCGLLSSILKQNKSDFSHIPSDLTSGIPQGPIASVILSELFLHRYIDSYFFKINNSNEVSYIRYADDIRIFAPSEVMAKKFITILDLLCRNCGLIPQSSKVGVAFFESSSDFIDQEINKFSQITKFFKINRELREKDNKKAKDILLEMFRSGDFNKTKLNFYIYKVSKDDRILNAILATITDRYEFCDQFLQYIWIHYRDDSDAIERLQKIFFEIPNKIFLDYPFYVFLKMFKDKIPFSSEIFYRLFKKQEISKWLSKYALLLWANAHGQKDVILSIEVGKIDNPILCREILEQKHWSVTEQEAQAEFEIQLLSSGDTDLIFKGIALMSQRRIYNARAYDSIGLSNKYLDHVLKNKIKSEISYLLRKHIEMTTDPSTLFNNVVFEDENEFDQITFLLNSAFTYYHDKNYKLFLDAVDQFDHVLVERLFIIQEGSRPQSKYGALLKNNCFLHSEMIGVSEIFDEIHNLRNGQLHPKNLSTGKFFPAKMKFADKKRQMTGIFNQWMSAVDQIVSWYNRKCG